MARRIGQGLLGGERRRGLVFTKHVPGIERVSERLDRGGIELAELRDEIDDLRELAGHPGEIVFSQGQAGKRPDLGDILR